MILQFDDPTTEYTAAAVDPTFGLPTLAGLLPRTTIIFLCRWSVGLGIGIFTHFRSGGDAAQASAPPNRESG